MPRQGSEIHIHFRNVPGVLFGASDHKLQHNVLALRVQPREGISLLMNAKTPGTVTRIAPAHMDFDYDVAFGSYSPEAYERLLLDAIVGDFTLFIRNDEVEGAWRIIDSIESVWEKGSPPLSFYPAGSWGPAEADTLMTREGRVWDPIAQSPQEQLSLDGDV